MKTYKDVVLFPYKFEYLMEMKQRNEAISLHPETIRDDIEKDLVNKKVKDIFGDELLYTEFSVSDLKLDHFN